MERDRYVRLLTLALVATAALAGAGVSVMRPALPFELSQAQRMRLSALSPTEAARAYLSTNDRRVQRHLEADRLRVQNGALYGWTDGIVAVEAPQSYANEELYPRGDWPEQRAVVVEIKRRVPRFGAETIAPFETYFLVVHVGRRTPSEGWCILETWESPNGGGLGI